MNAVGTLLHDLAAIGARIWPSGEQLVLRAGEKPIPGALVRRIREAKPDLLEVLGERRVVEWLDLHPSPSPPGRCAFCGQRETSDAVVLPFGTEPGTHTWLHAACWKPWHAQRRAEARSLIAHDVSHRGI